MTINCEKINLKKGNKGTEVKELQKILTEKRYYSGKLDGEYGEITEKAVKEYQKSQKLKQDGIFGPITCKKLNTNEKETINSTLKKGSKGEQVKQLQQKLQKLGYYNAEIDGEYGTKTVNAVKTYQTYYNLISDGVCGPLTNKALQETKTLTETTQSKRLSKALGVTIRDHGTLYMAVLKKGKYSYYNNDIYTYSEEIQRIEKGKAINCTDWGQCGMYTLLGMGFKKEHIRIVRGIVTCPNNNKTYGHVWLQLYLNGKWVNYDLSAAACHGSKMGVLICTKNPKITNINPGWAVSDDGKT